MAPSIPDPGSEGAKLGDAADHLRARWGEAPAVALVLGSGLKDFGGSLGDRDELPFGAVPHWPAPRVEGHGQSVVRGTVEGRAVVCLTGRVHLYEGWTPTEAVRAVRTLRVWGCETFVLTNAAGGIAAEYAPGDLMVVRDHLNLTGCNPMAGAWDAALGPRFPDQSTLYRPELRALLHELDPELREGVYAGLLGPTYETPAEVQMLRQLGAHAVGMSTVHEASALNAMGARVAAVSLISNAAAGVTGAPLSHDEVVAEGRRTAARFARLLTAFIRRA